MLLSIIVGYLLGSIPTAVWYGKFFHKIDIRQQGSGNAGATNSLRVLGKKAGAIVFLIDFLKGFIAFKLADHYFPTTELYGLALPFWVGFAVVIGHIFPVFAQFRGGKGVATAFGVIMAAFPMAALVCFVLFVGIVYLTKYVSLGSTLSGVAFPIQFLIGIWQTEKNAQYIIFGSIIALILIIMHRQNISRLLNGTESKVGKK